ncbi:MAG TPA: TIR domain-containing protein [Anaerolineales bacterium]|nr:TIR domain-containing protein [Anaerolineales bacterium]
MAQLNTAVIRKFIVDSFSDEELDTFCYDYHRDIFEQFGGGMSKTRKVQILIEGCERRGDLPKLLTNLRKERPELYDAKLGNLILETQPEQITRQRDPRRVFISYAYEDSRFAHNLADDLKAHGWHVWIAPESIRPGEKWVNAINRGLEECGVFIVVLTPVGVKSKWVVHETNVAIDLNNRGILRFIPLKVEDCELPPLWSAVQSVSFQVDYAEGLATLLAILEQKPLPSETSRRHLQKLPPLVAALKRNRRALVVITPLVLILAVLIGVEMIWHPLEPRCQLDIGQQVHVIEGKNVWPTPDVLSGSTPERTTSRTLVYVIGAPKWGLISWNPRDKDWWWEVSGTVNGESLGWVYQGFLEECQ